MNKVAQLVDYLANMHKALSLSPSNTNPRHSSNVSVIQHSGGPRGHGLLNYRPGSRHLRNMISCLQNKTKPNSRERQQTVQLILSAHSEAGKTLVLLREQSIWHPQTLVHLFLLPSRVTFCALSPSLPLTAEASVTAVALTRWYRE